MKRILEDWRNWYRKSLLNFPPHYVVYRFESCIFRLERNGMTKYFCDKCGKELSEPYCLYTIGWILCGICLPKFKEENTVNNILVIPNKLHL